MVYSILNVEPEPLTALRTGVPIALDGIAAKAMAKEPDARYQHVDEVPVDLKAVDLKSIDTSKILTTTIAEKAAQQPSRWRRAVPWSIAALMIVIAVIIAVIAVWYLKPIPTLPPQQVNRSVINLPTTERLVFSSNGNNIAISPDSRYMVYVADEGKGSQLYLHPMAQFESTPLPGTEGARHPFFSPDNRWVGFHADGKLKKVLLTGGSPLTICEVGGTYFCGATWGPDDNIIFGMSGSGLSRVSASEGIPEVISTLDAEKGERGHFWPEMLPGGKTVLFTIWKGVSLDNARIAVLSLETNERWVLLNEGGANARYTSTGHIAYALPGRIMAVPFNLQQLKVTGSPIPLIEGVSVQVRGAASFSFSDNGSLVYFPGGGAGMVERALVWVDRKGIAKPMTADKRPYRFPRISPDGRWVAFVIVDESGTNIWIYDVERGTQTPFTFKGSINSSQCWTTDGERLTFSSNRDGINNLYWKRSDGIGEAELILSGEYPLWGGSWSPDNKIAFYETNPTTQRDIFVFNMQDSTASPFLDTSADERSAMFSPDGHWLAYVSNKSGQNEVYIKSYPGPEREWQVSTAGGTEAMWAPDGQELFYRNGDKMMAVSFQAKPILKLGTPQVLFEGQYFSSVNTPQYDVHPDGDRFLMVTTATAEESTTSQINVVLNWFEELKSLFNTGNKR